MSPGTALSLLALLPLPGVRLLVLAAALLGPSLLLTAGFLVAFIGFVCHHKFSCLNSRFCFRLTCG